MDQSVLPVIVAITSGIEAQDMYQRGITWMETMDFEGIRRGLEQ